MKKRIVQSVFFILLLWDIQARAQTLENPSCEVRLQPNGSVAISVKAVSEPRIFSPAFTVISRFDDPHYEISPEKSAGYRIPHWELPGNHPNTHDLFAAGEVHSFTAAKTEFKDGKIMWTFSDEPEFAFAAELSLPDEHEPQITFHFTPRKKGWYSIGYTGAPAVSPDKLTSLWQPLAWQELRFPAASFLSGENMCSVPAALAGQIGGTYGVAADPAEIPFRMPTHRNSRFGVALRNQRGEAEPMIFSPILGQTNSAMEAGVPYSFRLRLVLEPGDCLQTFRSLARGLYGFRDFRENATCSLNQTLENEIDYAMSDSFCGWIAEQKGSDYSTDVPGSIKNVSALHPLSIALITDNEAIYQRRALPMTEYMLSREKYLFAPRESITGQGASHRMKGPAAEVSELAALDLMFQGRSEIFRHYALDLFDKPRALNLHMVSAGGSWQSALALFRLTGGKQYLARAISGADNYIARRIDTPQTNFSDVHFETGGQFWSDFAPKWVDLFELYDETKEPRFLKASLAGAYSYGTYAWMVPAVPAGDTLVNKGGKVGVHYANRIHDPQPMAAPEQLVPAWRVSQIGLVPEAASTHAHNPAVLLANHASYMLRLGQLSGDSFFHDIARSAIVGRYANFPGYVINGEFTTVYSRPDYPLRPWNELTYNNIFYNHVWPHLALVMDYLISDAEVKSAGQIDFPSRYAQGYAFLFCRVYGDRPGTFYGETNVHLWLPRQLLRTDNIQANYVVGYNSNTFYLAFLNQSPRPQTVTVTLNPDLIPITIGHSYPVRVWSENKPAPATTLEQGEVKISLAPNGITALAVDGLKVTPQFQNRVFQPAPKSAGQSFAMQETAFGKVTSMLLSMSPAVTSAYIWLDATPKEISQATLHVKYGRTAKKVVDLIYPFEFSVPLPAKEPILECWVETTLADGKSARSEPVRLQR